MSTREIAERIAKSVGFDTNSMSRDSEQRLTGAIDAALIKTIIDAQERAIKQREVVAGLLYDWIHENQVTHLFRRDDTREEGS
jgi:hypothetical protein